ncbi:radical SAM protein [Entomohabitans teleogrylli]|uniref:radical SAM protein n=1 Tax=Entomohabitans teleogrylli TaxID=1384589 RepID=UPI00073DAF39|nr:radical SAM protein [Entomohabitans teleogrylli]
MTSIPHTIRNPWFNSYARRYAEIERQTLQAIENYGLAFNHDDTLAQRAETLKTRLAAAGATFANGGKSIHSHWLSSACRACRTGEGSYTTFLSLKCHRDCYFCFNPNQQGYDYFQTQQRDAGGEIAQLARENAALSHVALTGGEPLLHKAQTIAFFSDLGRHFPQAHSRLYTAGDPLDSATARALRNAGLQEIRFSIKIDDTPEKQRRVLKRIALAREFIPDVMVEMPVLPGSGEQMRKLLMELDALGVDGINLLEFCFPLNNAAAYRERGFTLKYPPWQVYYNYWYAGGLAIAESENLCLELMLFALENKLQLGVHYCSLENKHTGQVYQQNAGYSPPETLLFSGIDYFFYSAKAFGDDIPAVEQQLRQHDIAFTRNLQHHFIQFNPQAIPLLRDTGAELCLSSFIVERDDRHQALIKEVRVTPITPAGFSLAAIQGTVS